MTSRIEAGVTIEGSIRGEGELEVAGRIRGAVTLKGTLVVEEGGIVEADVEATDIQVAGLLAGSATAHHSVQVLAGGKLDARVKAPRLLVDDGAYFRGELQSRGAEPSAPQELQAPGGRAGKSTSRRSTPSIEAPREQRMVSTVLAPEPPAKKPAPASTAKSTSRGRKPAIAPPEESAPQSARRAARSIEEDFPFEDEAFDAASTTRLARPIKEESPRMPALPKGRTTIRRRDEP